MKNKVHWCKRMNKWTSHTYKYCAKSEEILVNGDWSTEIKPHYKSNPKGWIVTDHTNVIINPNQELLSTFKKTKQLLYDKYNISFNIEAGDFLLFNKEGCFLLEKYK